MTDAENPQQPQIPLPPQPAAQQPAAQQPAAQQPAAPQPYAPQPGQQYGQPQYAQQPYVQQPYAPGPPRGLSVAAMVCGIVGVAFSAFFLGFFPALAGVVLGHIAQRRQPYARGFWLTGLITGYAGLALSVILLLVTVVLPLIVVWIALLGAGSSMGPGYPG